MNRFKKGKSAIPNKLSEFYGVSYCAEIASKYPKLWKSDRVRQEYLFCGVVNLFQRAWEITEEQHYIISAVYQKIDKIQNNIPLNGTEPNITFKEFTEWNVRYPID
jgi:hypothetical protein